MGEKKQYSRINSRYSSLDRRDMKTAYLMLLPAFVMITIFVIIPLVMAIQKSFFDWTFYIEPEFIGFKNFKIIIKTVYFRQSVVNALKFVVTIVPLTILVSFMFAHVLKNVSLKFANMVKTAIYIPGIVSGIAASVIFIFVLDYKGGILNQIVMAFGHKRIPFLSNALWSTVSIIASTIWLSFGGNTILMYAALVNVPSEYYEAASIDGASGFQKLIYITLPQLKNIFVLMCISLTTGTLQMFDLPYMMTGGGPRNTTLTPMLYLYNNYRDLNKSMGYTIAGALLMMIVIAIINSFVFTVIKSEKSIEG